MEGAGPVRVHSERCLRSVGHMTKELLKLETLKIHVKPCEKPMDKLQGVQCVGPLSGHSEPCLKSVGHMTKELLKFICIKKSWYFVHAP